MSLIRFNNLAMSFGGQELFAKLNAQINAGDHIGLVGPNGVGKTTLLRLIVGELTPAEGYISRLQGLRIAYLLQNPVYQPGQTALENVRSGLFEVWEIEKEMNQYEMMMSDDDDEKEKTKELIAKVMINPENSDMARRTLSSAENQAKHRMRRARASALPSFNKSNTFAITSKEKAAKKYAELLDRFTALGGAAAESLATSTLAGLGVQERLWNASLNSLSGGERNIVALARILISEYDLALFDEPGNHLDFSGLEWLENYLSNLKKAFIVVSHNRYLLDRVCTKIWELEGYGHTGAKLEQFGGNYSVYRSEKLTRALRQEAAFKRRQAQIERLEFQIRRLKAWGQVHDNPGLSKRAKAMERRIEKMDKVERPTEGKKLQFRLLAKPPKGTIALEARNYKKEFEDGFILLDRVSFLITQGERVAFIGNNGTGKSSLLKDVVQKGRWENPMLRVGASVRTGYYAQLAENLEARNNLQSEAIRLTGLSPGSAAELLHRFLFTRDDLEKPVAVLSGGEKARLQLAALIASGADMLLLDEPTNHLDIYAREAVEDALEEFSGTLIVVSHDRYFLDKLTDRVIYFQPPSVRQFDGNFSEFWVKLKSGAFETLTASTIAETIPVKASKRKVERQRFDPQRFKQLEAEIVRLENVRSEVEAELKTFIDKGKETFAERRRCRIAEINMKIDQLYEEWIMQGERKKKWR